MDEDFETMEIDERKKSLLQMVVEDAKQRILFYYDHIIKDSSHDEIISHIKSTLNNIHYGFDFDCDYFNMLAYQQDQTINVTKSFFSEHYCGNYEKQVSVMIHEMHHALSDTNTLGQTAAEKYQHADYANSYRIIEEGLADISSELVMNYYYDNSGLRVNYKESRNPCGYPNEKMIVKTLLAIMELQGIDDEMLSHYYFNQKELFFSKIIQLGSENIFKLIQDNTELEMGSEIEKLSKSKINEELFHIIEMSYQEELLKLDLPLKLFNKLTYNNVYYQNNQLIECLYLSHYTEELLKKMNIDIDNITTMDLEKMDVQIVDLFKRILQSDFVPSFITRIIKSWFNNCTEDNVDLIKKIIPNINEIENGTYFKMRLKLFKKISDDDLMEAISKMHFLLNSGYNWNEFNNAFRTVPSIIYDKYPEFLEIAYLIFPKLSENQKKIVETENLNLNINLEKMYLYQTILKELKVKDDAFDFLVTPEMINNLIENNSNLINRMTELKMDGVIEDIIRNCLQSHIDPKQLLRLIPDAFYRNDYAYLKMAEKLGLVTTEYVEKTIKEYEDIENVFSRLDAKRPQDIMDSWESVSFYLTSLPETTQKEFPFLFETAHLIFPKMNEEQKSKLQQTNPDFLLSLEKAYLYQKLLNILNIEDLHYFSKKFDIVPIDVINNLLENNSSLIHRMIELKMDATIDKVIKGSLLSHAKTDQILKVIPDAFYMERCDFLSNHEPYYYLEWAKSRGLVTEEYAKQIVEKHEASNQTKNNEKRDFK